MRRVRTGTFCFVREAHTKHVAALTATATAEDKVDSWCGLLTSARSARKPVHSGAGDHSMPCGAGCAQKKSVNSCQLIDAEHMPIIIHGDLLPFGKAQVLDS